jgi:hypothetical protein
MYDKIKRYFVTSACLPYVAKLLRKQAPQSKPTYLKRFPPFFIQFILKWYCSECVLIFC